MTTLVLVDDHRVVATSLKAYLESFPEFRVAGVAASGEELLGRVAEWQPDIVLQDLLLPGGMDGIATTRQLLARMPNVRVIVLTASVDEARMAGALQAGAMGYVRKDAEPEVLLAAVRSVARGRAYIDPSASRLLLRAEESLTPREAVVLRHLAQGYANKEIAAELGVGEETVKSHVSHLLAKLGADNRAQAIVQALKRGVIQLDELA